MAKAKKTKKVVAGAARSALKITVKTKENPRRAGTDAHKFFEAMTKSKTVGDYLKRFKDATTRRNASIWLRTNQKDNHVKIAA